MDRTHRIIWNSTDVSVALTDWRGDSLTLAYTSGDYVYIGCEIPFTYKYFDVTTANDQAANVAVSFWTGSAWSAAKDIIDETKVGGVSLARAGLISWAQDIDDMRWTPQRKSQEVTGLTVSEIYNLYWLRLSWSATLKATTALQYIGFNFSTDEALTGLYPDLANSDLKTAFASGKTTWREQHLLAAEAIVRDLKRRKILWSPEQAMAPELFLEAGCHKAAEIIYGGLGQAFAQARIQAGERYKDALNLSSYSVDANESGTLERSEQRFTTGTLGR